MKRRRWDSKTKTKIVLEGVPGAKVKKLAIMVACPDDRFEEIKLLLSNIGKVFL